MAFIVFPFFSEKKTTACCNRRRMFQA